MLAELLVGVLVTVAIVVRRRWTSDRERTALVDDGALVRRGADEPKAKPKRRRCP
jgi:hypothetical protein